MLLGSLLARLETADYATALLESTGDPVLLARIEDAGARHNEAPGDYAANAVGRFSQGASDEEWLALMTALERSEAPAQTCLGHMTRWALEADAEENKGPEGNCSCGGQGGSHAQT